MSDDQEARIRLRAHAIWEEQGRPLGRHEDHWRQAARELDATDLADPDPSEAPPPAR